MVIGDGKFVVEGSSVGSHFHFVDFPVPRELILRHPEEETVTDAQDRVLRLYGTSCPICSKNKCA